MTDNKHTYQENIARAHMLFLTLPIPEGDVSPLELYAYVKEARPGEDNTVYLLVARAMRALYLQDLN